jgi:hypothetical protein
MKGLVEDLSAQSIMNALLDRFPKELLITYITGGIFETTRICIKHMRNKRDKQVLLEYLEFSKDESALDAVVTLKWAFEKSRLVNFGGFMWLKKRQKTFRRNSKYLK